MKITALPLAFALLALCLLMLFLLPPTAAASMIGTSEVIAEQNVQADRDKVREFLDRANVQERLQVMDVPAALARSRIDG
nr:PA2779 family protein [uncultured Pseudomonas sp.]